jgi:hypothetical protein
MLRLTVGFGDDDVALAGPRRPDSLRFCAPVDRSWVAACLRSVAIRL